MLYRVDIAFFTFVIYLYDIAEFQIDSGSLAHTNSHQWASYLTISIQNFSANYILHVLSPDFDGLTAYIYLEAHSLIVFRS